jgi:hypothetical protein
MWKCELGEDLCECPGETGEACTHRVWVSPFERPSDAQREALELLIEECSEVIKRATKALRFGLGEAQPGKATNAVRLAGEWADLLVVSELCKELGCYEYADVIAGLQLKIKQLQTFLQTSGARVAINELQGGLDNLGG